MAVIPSGVEESLDTSEGARDVSTSLDMTTRLFAALDVYRDDSAASAALNMAIDEALLEDATVPSIRFYRWHSPALSFGYFGRFIDVAIHASGRDLVRRWTGGGMVFHGEDLTYSIVIPCDHSAFGESSMAVYERIHRALADAWNEIGKHAHLAESMQRVDRTLERGLPAASCFANPVRSDVMIDGRKIAGAAQRRTRRGLLQQGSIQGVELESKFAERFVQALSANCGQRYIDGRILDRAYELAERKYATDAWLRQR
jgi:lipoate-protein ligase A